MLKNFFQLCNNNEFRFLKYCRGLILSFTQCKMPTKIAYLSEGSHKKTTTTMYTNSRETAPILMWMHVVVVVAIIFFFQVLSHRLYFFVWQQFFEQFTHIFFSSFFSHNSLPELWLQRKTHTCANQLHPLDLSGKIYVYTLKSSTVQSKWKHWRELNGDRERIEPSIERLKFSHIVIEMLDELANAYLFTIQQYAC